MAEYAVLKRFPVSLDLKGELPVPPFEVVEGDTGNVLVVSVTDGGSAVPIEDMYVTAVFQSAKGTRLLDSEDGSMSLDANTAEITLLPTAFSAGPVACELQIRSSSLDSPVSREDYDILVTTARFSFYCRGAMLNEEALEALPETPLLDAYLAQAASEEAARQAAEAARAAAEAARVTAENARAAAETAREQSFSALLASAIAISKTGNGAPTSSTAGSSGQLYFDLTNKTVYVCTAESPAYAWRELQFADGSANALTVQRTQSYEFGDIPTYEDITLQELMGRLGGWYSKIDSMQSALDFDTLPAHGSSAAVTSGGVYDALHAADWTDISVGTLVSDVSVVTIDSYSAGLGTGGFSFDELMLVIVGEMVGANAARIFVNGSSTGYLRFASFAHADTGNPGGCMTCVYLKKPVEGFVRAERTYGGDTDNAGYVASIATHCATIKKSGLTAYTGVKVAAEGMGEFAAGSKVILMGRNCR